MTRQKYSPQPVAGIPRRKFRDDLFCPLSVIRIYIPLLHDRKDDFIQHYNTQFRNNVKGITPEGLQLLMNYSWPGNIRELKTPLSEPRSWWTETRLMWNKTPDPYCRPGNRSPCDASW